MPGRALLSVSTMRRPLQAILCAAGAAGAIVLASLPAAAQVVIGGESSPNVIVDYSVLDELGHPPSVPQVLMERPAGRPASPYAYSTGPRFPLLSGSGRWEHQGPIVLKPPSSATQRPASRQRQAATPRPPPKPAASARPAAPKPVKPARTAERSPPAPKSKPAAGTASAAKPQSLMPPPPPELSPAPSDMTPPPPPPVSTARLPEPPPDPPKPAAPRRAAPAPKASQPARMAAVPQTPTIQPGSLRRIGFAPGSAKLSPNAGDALKTVADAMARDEALRIQLLAYAGQADDSASQARRLSLSRALAARSQLIEQGVRSTRIDVRALGNKSAGGPADRIDIIVTKR